MALSSVSYPGDGSQTEFNVTIPYISRSHMSVLLDDVPTSAWSWTSDTMIELDDPPAEGVVVKIKRTTPSSARLVGFQRGSTLDADADLDTDSNQLMYLLQELSEGSLATVVSEAEIADGAITTAKFNPAAKAPLAGAADTATNATNAANAANATEAAHAADADTADYATEAGHATTTDSATAAGSATTADTAGAVDADGVDTAAVQDDAITNAKLANMAAASVKMRPVGAGTGDPVDGTADQLVTLLNTARKRFACRDSANAPRPVGNARGLKAITISGTERIFTFEGSGSLRLLEMNKITDQMITRFTATGKVPKDWCWTGSLFVCANGTTDLFSVDPTGWTNPTSGAGARADYLLFDSGNDCVWGFDNSAKSIERIDKSTLAVLNTYTTGLSNGIGAGTESPWALANNCLYHFDAFGQLRKFDCATQAVTSLSGVVASFGSGNQSILLGSDGLLYLVSNTQSTNTNNQKVTVLDPATDTVVTTIDLSSYVSGLAASSAGFHAIAEIQGYLYVCYATQDATNLGTIIGVKLSDYSVAGSLTVYGSGAPTKVAGFSAAGETRGYVAIGGTNETTITAFDG